MNRQPFYQTENIYLTVFEWKIVCMVSLEIILYLLIHFKLVRILTLTVFRKMRQKVDITADLVLTSLTNSFLLPFKIYSRLFVDSVPFQNIVLFKFLPSLNFLNGHRKFN